jgi:hypothetical protein
MTSDRIFLLVYSFSLTSKIFTIQTYQCKQPIFAILSLPLSHLLLTNNALVLLVFVIKDQFYQSINVTVIILWYME